ncbi:MAG: sulfatase-like hydrolase/transferase, partial [Planctomycetota bacterium]|nr:sulfatase-like hydrolase/transferase [Planctomycetota bacterium]
FHGPWYGFSYVETARMHADESHAGQHYALWLEERGLKNWKEYFQPWPPDPNRRRDALYFLREQRHWNLPQELHHTRWVAERTVAAMERSAASGRPFCLWSSFFDPHPPYIVSEPWASMYRPEDMQPGRLVPGELDRMPPHFRKTQEAKPDFSAYREPGGNALHGCHSHLYPDEELRKDMAVYYGMISFIDQQLGAILDALERLGQAQNTLVVFTTDHGHFMGQHGLIAKGPFHYEDMIRVPMLVRCPGTVPAGKVSRSLQSLVDYPQTLLRAAGLEAPGWMQGVDQWDVWCGRRQAARDHVLVENRHNPTRMHLRTYVDERYKLTVYRGESFGELFDLESDPGETRNLWDEPSHAALKASLFEKFLQAELQREPLLMPRVAGA